MGTKLDMRRRTKLREDNAFVQSQIETVRRKVFTDGVSPGGSVADRYLKEYSLLPTRVSFLTTCTAVITHEALFTERVLDSTVRVRSEPLPALPRRRHARVRTWGMEKHLSAHHPRPICHSPRGCPRYERQVGRADDKRALSRSKSLRVYSSYIGLDKSQHLVEMLSENFQITSPVSVR